MYCFVAHWEQLRQAIGTLRDQLTANSKNPVPYAKIVYMDRVLSRRPKFKVTGQTISGVNWDRNFPLLHGNSFKVVCNEYKGIYNWMILLNNSLRKILIKKMCSWLK